MEPGHSETFDGPPRGSFAVSSPSGSPEPAEARAQPGSPVAGALATLTTIDELPLDEQPDAYLAIHDQLRGALAEIDDA